MTIFGHVTRRGRHAQELDRRGALQEGAGRPGLLPMMGVMEEARAHHAELRIGTMRLSTKGRGAQDLSCASAKATTSSK
jgi:hypothetical protein